MNIIKRLLAVAFPAPRTEPDSLSKARRRDNHADLPRVSTLLEDVIENHKRFIINVTLYESAFEKALFTVRDAQEGLLTNEEFRDVESKAIHALHDAQELCANLTPTLASLTARLDFEGSFLREISAGRPEEADVVRVIAVIQSSDVADSL